MIEVFNHLISWDACETAGEEVHFKKYEELMSRVGQRVRNEDTAFGLLACSEIIADTASLVESLAPSNLEASEQSPRFCNNDNDHFLNLAFTLQPSPVRDQTIIEKITDLFQTLTCMHLRRRRWLGRLATSYKPSPVWPCAGDDGLED